VPVYTPLPETAEDLMQKYGITAEQAGDGSPDLRWLLREKKGHARPYAPGDRPLAGVQAFPSREGTPATSWVMALISVAEIGRFTLEETISAG
jgi:hypothetical protein